MRIRPSSEQNVSRCNIPKKIKADLNCIYVTPDTKTAEAIKKTSLFVYLGQDIPLLAITQKLNPDINRKLHPIL